MFEKKKYNITLCLITIFAFIYSGATLLTLSKIIPATLCFLVSLVWIIRLCKQKFLGKAN